jgi:hypothetical protein
MIINLDHNFGHRKPLIADWEDIFFHSDFSIFFNYHNYVEPVKWTLTCPQVIYWATSALRRFSEIFTKIFARKISNLLETVVPTCNAELWIDISLKISGKQSSNTPIHRNLSLQESNTLLANILTQCQNWTKLVFWICIFFDTRRFILFFKMPTQSAYIKLNFTLTLDILHYKFTIKNHLEAELQAIQYLYDAFCI